MGLVCAVAVPVMKADSWNRRTVVTFHQPVEVPRHVLIPGTYVMKLLNLDSHRDIVQVTNRKETQVIATFFAVPAYQPNVVYDHTVFTYEERAANSPQAIKTWYYPGNPWGEEFIYPKAETIAARPPATNFTPRPAPPNAVVQPKPAPVIAQNTAPAPEPAKPVEIAQTAPTPAVKEKELPKTASVLPLIALLGSLAAASGLALKTFRKSM